MTISPLQDPASRTRAEGTPLRMCQRKRSLELPNNLAPNVVPNTFKSSLAAEFFSLFRQPIALFRQLIARRHRMQKSANARTPPHRTRDCSGVPGTSRLPRVQNREVAGSAQLTGAPIFQGI